MRWRGRERSDNVEDRRGMSPKAAIGGGGLGVMLIAMVAMFMGADRATIARLLGQARGGAAQQQQQQQRGAAAPDDEAREFISVVLKDTEEVWNRLFVEQGRQYAEPTLVIFSDSVRSGCGPANSAVGPFYCPADQKVYIDPSFFEQLRSRHRAPGDFAQAYVIAHEVGHHVQALLGFSNTVEKIRRQGNKLATNRASVRLELQADYLAGVWAHHAHKNYRILEEGDIDEAINAANQIGDDTLQRQAQGYVVPERYTHGTSAQRMRWFKEGLLSGELARCQLLFDLQDSEL